MARCAREGKHGYTIYKRHRFVRGKCECCEAVQKPRKRRKP